MIKMSYLGSDKMICNFRQYAHGRTVRDNCDLVDFPVMALNKFEMGEKRAEIMPAGEMFIYSACRTRVAALTFTLTSCKRFDRAVRSRPSIDVG